MPASSSKHPTKEVFQRIADRLANTGQVLSSWEKALGSRDRALRQRLEQAAHALSTAVGALCAEGAHGGIEVDEDAEDFRRAAGAGALGLSGRSEVISLVEFLSFLAGLGRDGVLHARSPQGEFTLELRGDCVVHVACDPPIAGQSLDEILVARGLVGADELKRCRAETRAEEVLPEALLRQDLVEMEALRDALAAHAQLVFLRMHGVPSGFDFRFEENARLVETVAMRLSVSHLLLESARQYDEHRHAMKGPEEDPNLVPFRAGLDQALGSGAIKLPVLPDATAQLLAMCWSDEFDVDDFRECVLRDQALCAHLLRVANSAMYAPTTPISSVQLAIARIGLDKLREVTLALTLKQSVFQLPGWEELIRSLWRTAAITSGFATAIGKRCGTGAVRGSMIGLLLDVGKPVVLDALYAVQKNIGIELTPGVAGVLMEEYHGRLGTLLVDKWSLPPWLASVTSHHHDYAEAGEHRLEAMVGHLAAECVRLTETVDEMELGSLKSLPVCEELHLGTRALRAILGEAESIRAMADVYA